VSDGTNTSAVETVSLSVTNSNDNTPGGNTDSYGLNEGATLNEPAITGVLANDSDADGDPPTASLASGPANSSSFTLNPDGPFTYQHDGGETTNDSFTYTVSDGTTSTTATVTLVIDPVNDAPTGNADSYVIINNTTLSVATSGGVLANDSDAEADTLTAVLVTAPGNGTLTLQSDGSFVYTADSGFNGTDSFEYRVTDGLANSTPITVTLTVTAVVTPLPDSPSVDVDPEPEPEPETLPEEDTELPTANVEPAVVNEPGTTVTSPTEEALTEAVIVLAAPSTSPSDSIAAFLTVQSRDEQQLNDAAQQTTRVLNSADVNSHVQLTPLDFGSSSGLDFGDENLSFVIDTAYLTQLEAVDGEVLSEAAIETWVTGSAVMTGTGLSVGYIVWMIRGGYLMASLMSVLPVWQNVDPLHVLDALADDDDDDESLEEMIEKAEQNQDSSSEDDRKRTQA